MGWGSSKRTTINEDNRTINDLSGSTFDNSVDSSQSFEDKSYNDESFNYEDSSYKDESITNDGYLSGNSGSIQVLDGGAIEMAKNAVSDAVSLSKESLNTANHAINQNTYLSSNALASMGKTAGLSMQQSQMNVEIMRDTTANALIEMSGVVGDMKDQAQSTVNSSILANKQNLEGTQKLMTTISANGNDLLVDGVVSVAKYGAIGLGSLALGFVVVKLIGAKK